MRLWLALTVLLPAMSRAELTGTWVIQPELTAFERMIMPTTVSLDRGIYRRTDCRGDPIDMPADGSFHPVKKQPFFDRMAVRVIDRHRVVIEQKVADKTTWKGAYTVSKDAAGMILEFENDLADKPVTGTLQYAREGAAVAGAHPLTGTWLLQKLIRLSPSGSSLTFAIEQNQSGQVTDNAFTFVAGDGRSAEGRTDAKDYPLHGYLDGATLSVSQPQPNVWSMNRKQNAMLVEIWGAKVADDGRTMTLRQSDWICHEIAVFTLHKK